MGAIPRKHCSGFRPEKFFHFIFFFPVFPLHGQLAQQMRAFSNEKEEPGQSHYRKNTGRVAKVRLG
jgi:hypothetical protein